MYGPRTADERGIEGRCERQDGPTHDLHCEHPDPSRPSLSWLSLAANESDEQREENLSFRRELGGELLEKEKNDARAAKREGKGGTLREGFEEQRAEMVLQQEQELRMLLIHYVGRMQENQVKARTLWKRS
jgi:hypothetical protein